MMCRLNSKNNNNNNWISAAARVAGSLPRSVCLGGGKMPCQGPL